VSKQSYISDLKNGDAVDDVFYLRGLKLRKTAAGVQYLALTVGDRGGVIEGRVWNNAPSLFRQLAYENFIRVRARAELYRERLQLNIGSIEIANIKDIDQRDFVPRSYRDSEELTGFLHYFLTEIDDPDFSRLLEAFFGDPSFMERFSLAPGDVRSHHAYLGGLIEHTVSVATLCQHVTVQHPRLKSDLLITAALLHDLGKVEEFRCDGQIRLSREGRLLGHVLIGQRLVEEKIKDLGGFPREKELELLHAIISHHGELEWGAPKRPQSAEALVLHHIDNLDAKVKGFLEVVEGHGEVTWPELQNLFRRPLGEPQAADRQSTTG